MKALATLALMWATSSLMAAQLQVTVLGSDGKPAADVVVQAVPTAAWPSQPTREPALIVQQGTRFVPFVTAVPAGSTVRFVNRDRYDHHVRSQPGGQLGNVPAAQQFEFRMPAYLGRKEATADLKLQTPGSITLGCHLHGSMRGHIFISITPWVAVTDDKGQATLAGLPEGQLELKLWHPDELGDQAGTRLQLAGNQAAEQKLNFTPRKRPAPNYLREDSKY